MTMVSRLQSARNSGRSWEVSDEICSHHARTRMADAPHANKRDQATGTISGERRLTVCKIHAVPEPASPRTNRCDPCARGPNNPTATKATTLPHIRATFSGASPMDSAILISDDPNMMATYPQKSAEANASSAMPPL